MSSPSDNKAGPKRAAVVGLGWWGQHIIRQTAESDIVRVVRAVGSREEHRVNAEKLRVDFTTDFAGTLADPSIDFVVLATPHAHHAAQIEEAAHAGKHVFCEKPVALSMDGMRTALEACRSAGIRLGVGHERRFEPAVEEVRKLLADSFFGAIMHIEAEFHHDKLRGISADNWRVSEQGGIPLAMTATGIHLTDLFLDLMGPIESVAAFPATRTANAGYADTFSVHVGFASGATGYLSTVLATPFYSRLAMFGDAGWAEIRDSVHPDEAGPSTITVARRNSKPIVTTLDSRDAVRANLERFALAIGGEETYPFTEEQILGNVAVMTAISRSAKTGRSVKVAELI